MFRGLCENISWVARRKHNNNGAIDLRRTCSEDVNNELGQTSPVIRLEVNHDEITPGCHKFESVVFTYLLHCAESFLRS